MDSITPVTPSAEAPEFKQTWLVSDAALKAARRAIKSGINYLEVCLVEHVKTFNGKPVTNLKDKLWLDYMHADLIKMTAALDALPKPGFE